MSERRAAIASKQIEVVNFLESPGIRAPRPVMLQTVAVRLVLLGLGCWKGWHRGRFVVVSQMRRCAASDASLATT